LPKVSCRVGNQNSNRKPISAVCASRQVNQKRRNAGIQAQRLTDSTLLRAGLSITSAVRRTATSLPTGSNGLRCGLLQFEARAQLLQTRGKRIDLLLLPPDNRLLFLILAVLF